MEERLKSPTQLDKAGFGEMIGDFVERPERAPALAPESDPREPIDFTPGAEFPDE